MPNVVLGSTEYWPKVVRQERELWQIVFIGWALFVHNKGVRMYKIYIKGIFRGQSRDLSEVQDIAEKWAKPWNHPYEIKDRHGKVVERFPL